MANYYIFPPLGAPSSPWTSIVDIIFFLGANALVAWYYYYYLRKDLLGKFWGAMLVSAIGALIVFALLQNFIREVIMWLMSPKIGSTQLSNVNLIAIFLGGFIALYLMNRINHNKERRD
ncbi:MAG: hypothetical protein O9346_03780 [Leptospiraceae bacterium]|nr:hypothetical protein [Leptospiraceae bacterium]MCZ8345515.1 hypothetical protein [Leptospiraceae bacterium]PJE00849.1 MAG: hypothetical protein CK427_12650 [Leptospira sp.]